MARAVHRSGPAERPAPKLREQAYSSFTRHLLAREIRPGQFVSQRELVELTGLPLGAIRELIPRLEAEGLIVTVPQRGLQIAQIDVGLVRNAFQFRLILEREAAAQFAATASEREIERLAARHRAIVERALRKGPQGLVDEAQAIDQDLHETVIDHLRNEIISNAYRVNWIKIRLIRQNETRLYGELVVPVMQDHLKIIERFAARDAAGAAEAMARHISNARERALEP